MAGENVLGRGNAIDHRNAERAAISRFQRIPAGGSRSRNSALLQKLGPTTRREKSHGV